MNHPKLKSTQIPVITIDGPGGSGKGTIGLLLAEKLGWHFLDSGALYRVLALAALNQGVDLGNEQNLEKLALELKVQFKGDIILDGKSVTKLIRSEQCGSVASQIAIFPRVRAVLLEKFREFSVFPGLVADGRDMGTVVFPGAICKIYLEASVEERAERRYRQLKDRGQSVTLGNLLEEIAARDARDKGRVTAPLKPSKDAVVIDTTGLGIEEVFEEVMKVVKQRLY